MALDLDPTIEKQPEIPDNQAHQANSDADAAADVHQSREYEERRYREEMNRPITQKIVTTPPETKLIYFMIAVAYLAITWWEWETSRPIYEILISDEKPWLPFAAFVAGALVISACLGEGTERFALFTAGGGVSDAGNRLRTADIIRDRVYDRPRGPSRPLDFFIVPTTGAVLASLFLFGIYRLSQERVDLLRDAGQLAESSIQLWLPVILFAVEILFGIAMCFLLVNIVIQFRLKWYTKKLTKRKAQERALTQAACEGWFSYIARFQEHNQFLRSQSKPDRVQVPANDALCKLLREQWGIDPRSNENNSPPNDGGRSPNGNQGAPSTVVPDPADARANGHDNGRGDPRVDDLINLVDEEINKKNRGL